MGLGAEEIEPLLGWAKSWSPSPELQKLCVAVESCKSSTWELEAKRSGVQVILGCHQLEMEVNPGYMRSEFESKTHTMEGQNQLPASCPLIFTGTPRQISPHLTHELCKTVSKILIES